MAYLLKNLLIVLIITLVLGAGYYFIVRKGTDEFSAGSNIDTPVYQQTEKILRDTQRINEFKLSENDDIFEDQRFTSLVDTRVTLKDVTPGRKNPFVPVN
jgi:hypothetical protein